MLNRWTIEEIEYLKDNYAKLSVGELVKILIRHPKSSIIYKANSLNLKNSYFWTLEETEFLKDNYKKLNMDEISNILKIPVNAVKSKYHSLHLYLEKWSEEDEEYLKNNFSDLSNLELSQQLNRSIRSITKKAYNLKLKKSKNHRSKQISKRNKMVTRDLNFELVKEIALQYKCRGVFQLNDSSAYQTAKNHGWLDQVCSHMFFKHYSTPQLILRQILEKLFNITSEYNTRKIIKPYELDIYFEKYNLAFEYNGKTWHGEDKDSFKRDIEKIRICKERNIKLIIFIENSRNYEDDIKNQGSILKDG